MDRQLVERLASHSTASTSASLAHSITRRSSRPAAQRAACACIGRRGLACWESTSVSPVSVSACARVAFAPLQQAASNQRRLCHAAAKPQASAARDSQPQAAVSPSQQQSTARVGGAVDGFEDDVGTNGASVHKLDQPVTSAAQADPDEGAEQYSSDEEGPYVAPDVYEAQLQLSRDIREAGGWRELRDLFKEHKHILNPIHISALLARLRQVLAEPRNKASAPATAAAASTTSKQAKFKEQQEVRALISAILAASHPLLPEFGAPEMSGTLHALAKLRVRPPAAWVSAAMEHTKGVLSEAGPWQLGTLMWSLGMLNIDPGPAWLDAFCAASTRCMQRASRSNLGTLGTPFASSNSSGNWGSSGNDILGSSAGRFTFTGGERGILWSSGGFREQCSIKAMVNMAWGLARVKHNVPPAWSEAFCAQIAGRWGELDPFSCSNIAWALATLGVWPGEEWLASFCTTTARLLPQFNTWDLSVTLWAYVSWEYNPGSAWLAQFLARTSSVLPRAQPEHIARILWGLAALGAHPPRQWMMRVYRQTLVQAFEFDAQSFSNTFWAAARLGAPPPKEWVETMLLAIFEQGMEGWGPQEMSNTAWALARVGHIPDPAWLDLLWSESFCQLDRFSPQQLMSLMWAMVKLGQRPPDQWLRHYLKVSQPALLRLPPEGLANLAWCMASLEVLAIHRHSTTAVRSTAAQPSSQEGVSAAEAGSAASNSNTKPFMSSSSSSTSRVRSKSSSTSGIPAGLASQWVAALVDASLRSLRSGQWGRTDQAAVSYWCSHDSDRGTFTPGASNSSSSRDSIGGVSSSSSTTSTNSSSGGTESAPSRQGVWGRGPLGQASCKLAWGLAKLHAPVPQELMDLILAVTGPQLSSLRLSNLGDLAYTLALLRVKPSQRWTAALIQAVEGYAAVLKQVSRLNLGKLIFGARRLGVPPEVCQRWGASDWIGREIEMLENL